MRRGSVDKIENGVITIVFDDGSVENDTLPNIADFNVGDRVVFDGAIYYIDHEDTKSRRKSMATLQNSVLKRRHHRDNKK